jgi:peptide/nickel transport system substrate-binding protein
LTPAGRSGLLARIDCSKREATLMHRATSLLRASVVACAALALAAPALAQQGNTVVTAVSSDPGHFNPGITTGYDVHVVADSIFNGLVALDEELNPIPDLATSWTVSDDSTVYTFELADARWHDGEPFTSEDVKFSFENVLFNYHSRTKAGLGAVVAAIETPDARTVVFRMKEPYGPLLQRLDVTEAPILPKHIFESGGDPNDHPANLQPVGTGPFRLASYSPDDTITLERNPDYFKDGLPHLDKLIFRVIPDDTTQLLALERGELDYLNRIPLADVERLQEKGGYTIVATATGPGGGNCIMTMAFNLDRPLLQRLEVRQAIAQAIDRRRIVDQVLFGWGDVAEAPISSPIGWAHWPPALEVYAYDPAKAEAILDSAGHARNGDAARFSIDMVHFPTFNKYAEVMKQDLAKVGIDLISRPLDRAAAVDAIFTQRDFDTNLISYCNGTDPDIGVKRMYVSSNIGPIPFSNAAAYRNERVDQLFDAAGKTSVRETRREAYREAQEILGQDLPYWWLVETTFVSGYKDSLEGFRPWTGQFAEHAQYKP